MRYRQSHEYAKNMGSARPAGNITKAGRISTSGGRAGTVRQIPGCRSRRPTVIPISTQRTEIKLIRNMRRRNPNRDGGAVGPAAATGLHPDVRRPVPGNEKAGAVHQKRRNPYKPKPYQTDDLSRAAVQVDVKVVPQSCIADPELRLYQYTAIDEFSRCDSWKPTRSSTYSSRIF